ncbi:glutamine--fructose-6-phosphate transaminase (isomerizing) [Candidatus Parcubacteria bacterium]|nr:glutamine--fructose-6-phosphate transaminase (isomerizing) [Candidatus Parcubacteria bacterium]
MCGIVGYIGTKDSSTDFVLAGLKALEYRGYDSAGLVTIDNGRLKYLRDVGRVANLEKLVKRNGHPAVATRDNGLSGEGNFSESSGQSRTSGTAAGAAQQKIDLSAKSTGGVASSAGQQASAANVSCGIGHTRWATHGSVTEFNAHPHANSSRSIFVVCNGIIENYQDLKADLIKKGYKFKSETDTEVIPHLIDHYLKTGDGFFAAFKTAIADLRGAYAIAAVYTEEPEKIYAARLSSPIVIGVGNGEHFLASDPSALIHKTKKVIFLNDFEVAEISANKAHIESLDKTRKEITQVVELDYDHEESELGTFPHFMLKEIHEAPMTIKSAIRGRVKPDIKTIKLGGLESVKQQLTLIDRIIITACGTSYYAGLIGEYLIEEIAGIPVEVQLASEFKYRKEPLSRGTAVIAISQSGETADTVAAIKKVEDYGILKLGIVNAVGSTLTRITDAGVYCHAGPEQSVATTKAFLAQVTILTEIALHLSDGKSKLFTPLLKELTNLPDKAQKVVELAPAIEILAKKYAHYRDFLFIGRNYLYPCALEGALKLKEISYIHAEGCSAGEMKHGPLAMIDENFPTFALACDSSLLDKTMSNIEEIKARKGPIIATATVGNKKIKSIADDVIYLPKTAEQLQPILSVIAMQLFAYYIAVEKGLDVDRPRNLAKSVTVE